MSSKNMSLLVKMSAVVMALAILLACGVYLPIRGSEIIKDSSTMIEKAVKGWSLLIWTVSLIWLAVLFYVWRVSDAIKSENVFTFETAGWIKAASVLIFISVAVFLMGNIIFAVLKINSLDVVIPSLLGMAFCSMLATFAMLLSGYVKEAAALKEENEGTV